MASSRSFGSVVPDLRAHCGLAFAPAPRRLSLNPTGHIHAPVDFSIDTPSGSGRPRPPRTARTYAVSGALSLPSTGCFSPFPRGTPPLSVVAGTSPWEVVPPASDGLPRAPPYSRTSPSRRQPSSTGLSPAPGALSSRFPLSQPRQGCLLRRHLSGRSTPTPRRPQPTCTEQVWARPRSLATTWGVFPVPRGTKMFQFPRFPPPGL